jgi:hypothetical protein
MTNRLSIERLREVLDLDTETGVLTWRVKIAKKTVVGAPAGSQRHDGYITLQIEKVRVLAHHAVFALVYGRWPVKELDHANGNPADNRPCNLREANRHTNNYNRRTPSNNTSGIKGVFKQARGKCWHARLTTNGVLQRVGGFQTKEQATDFLDLWRDMSHGEFAKHV